jgi:integrase/recombinase XerC
MRKQLTQAQPDEMEIIDAYIEHLRREGCTQATREGRYEILHRLNRELPYGIGQTNTEELSRWLYRDEWSTNTKATYWRAIRSFYSFAANIEDPWIDKDPTAKMPPVQTVRGVPRPVTDEQLARILAEAPAPIRTWSLLAAYQGFRSVEISRADREHFTELQTFIPCGKGNRPAVMDTDPDVWAAVKGLPRGPIAVGDDGERLTPFEVSLHAAHHFRRQMGMPGVALHRLRHWFGVNVQRRFKNTRVTQAMLRHASLASTQIYTDATDEEQRAARATLPRFGGEPKPKPDS